MQFWNYLGHPRLIDSDLTTCWLDLFSASATYLCDLVGILHYSNPAALDRMDHESPHSNQLLHTMTRRPSTSARLLARRGLVLTNEKEDREVGSGPGKSS